MWKYYSSISQLGFFIFYIIFPFFHFTFNHTFYFFFFFFSSTHVSTISTPLLLFSFSPSFSLIQNVRGAPFSLSFSSSLSLFFFFTWFQNSLCDKKIFLFSLIQEHSRELSSSSPTQSRWVRWLLSFAFSFFLLWFD